MTDSYCVKTIKEPIHWEVEVPGSKSITNRALLMAALVDGTVTLNGVLFSDDSRYFLSSLQSLGFSVAIEEEKRRVTVTGCGGAIPVSCGEIYVGSAGTAARFLTAMLGVSEGTYVIQASAQMQRRPMKALFEAVLNLGAQVEWLGEQWHLPVRITGAGRKNVEPEGMTHVALDISESTQFLSALLLISPMFSKGLHIQITSAKKDGSYIRISRKMMQEFGVDVSFDGSDYTIEPGSRYRIEEYQIEPDVSAACYFYAAAAITGGYSKVKHVHFSGMQGDLKFLGVLEQMGCEVTDEADGISVTGPDRLRGIDINMNDFSDQALTLAAIAPYASAPVHMSGIAHIRGQECDRLHAMASNLTRAGISVDEGRDEITILPGMPARCSIETFEDHRVAMSFAVMGLKTEGIVIEHPECCRKTFENYFELLDKLCKKFDN